MFYGFAFGNDIPLRLFFLHDRVILELFDAQGGLRTLLNVMSTLEIFSNDETLDLLSEDALYSSRQLCRHVAVAFRRYFEAHLCIMSENIRFVRRYCSMT